MASLKTRRKLLATGGVEIGSATNMTDFDTAGRQTLVGTARVYKDLWFPATMWYGIEPDGFVNAFNATAATTACTPIVVPKMVYGGGADASPIAVPTMAASCAENKDARAALCFVAPPDAASSGSSTVTLYYTTRGAHTALDMQVWRLNWQYFGTGTSDVGGQSGSILYGASMVSTGSGCLEVQTLGQMHAFRSASPFCVVQLKLANSDGSAFAGAPDESIYGMKIRYIAENLGVQVT